MRDGVCRGIALSMAALGLLGCGGPFEDVPVGRVCVFESSPVDDGLRVIASPAGCWNSCTDVEERRCDATWLDANTLRLDVRLRLREGDGDCSGDCNGADVMCGTIPDVPGDYTILADDLRLDLTIPIEGGFACTEWR